MDAGTSGSRTLPRARRIKQGRDFTRAKLEGKRAANGCLIANWLVLPETTAASRVGVITSRKVGDAVKRSRARRLLREAFRVHQADLARPVDLVLVARSSIVGKTFAEVEKDLLGALNRAGLLKETK
jgi:ribonuclease P protein component